MAPMLNTSMSQPAFHGMNCSQQPVHSEDTTVCSSQNSSKVLRSKVKKKIVLEHVQDTKTMVDTLTRMENEMLQHTKLFTELLHVM